MLILSKCILYQAAFSTLDFFYQDLHLLQRESFNIDDVKCYIYRYLCCKSDVEIRNVVTFNTI